MSFSLAALDFFFFLSSSLILMYLDINFMGFIIFEISVSYWFCILHLSLLENLQFGTIISSKYSFSPNLFHLFETCMVPRFGYHPTGLWGLLLLFFSLQSILFLLFKLIINYIALSLSLLIPFSVISTVLLSQFSEFLFWLLYFCLL